MLVVEVLPGVLRALREADVSPGPAEVPIHSGIHHMHTLQYTTQYTPIFLHTMVFYSTM